MRMGDLLELLRDEDGVPHLDVFILTHPDLDHCRGYKRDFYQGDPAKYSKKDKDDKKILIDQMWFSPRIFQDHEDLNDEAQAIRDELDRRKKLFVEDDSKKADEGNRLWCIGYSDSDELKGLADITTIPGNSVSEFNQQERDDLSFFIFAPVKKDSDDEDSERNNTSIAFAAEFHFENAEAGSRALFFGDNSRHVLERIYDQNEKSERLEYDLLFAPHHCSWYTFSDSPDGDVSEKVQALLGKKRDEARVVASSKPVKNNDDNPPSYKAKKQYVAVVGEDNFICTEEWPNEDSPTKLVFVVTANGLEQQDPTESDKKKSTKRSSIEKATTTPTTYGRS
jgi:hypothetical protein